MIETPRTIAQDGGWRVYAAATLVQLLDPYRHHSVVGRAGPDVYVLPAAMMRVQPDSMGKGLPIGSVVWVHNRNAGGHAVTIRNSDSTFTFSCSADASCGFLLTGDASEAGSWVYVEANAPSGRGAAQPIGEFFDVPLTQSQNNFNLLQAVVAQGYDGTAPAVVRLSIGQTTVLGSTSQAAAALDIGGDVPVSGVNWAAGSLIVVRNRGVISGRGGNGGGGGIGGTGASDGLPGEDGGLALRTPVSITIENLGVIQGGGGGGGGGDGQLTPGGVSGGPGGGGAGATIDAVGAILGGRAGFGATGTTAAQNGTLTTGGLSGAGSAGGGTTGGNGGFGGPPATVGAWANNVGNTLLSATGFAGLAGAAISRATAATITFVTAGTVTGATVVT